MPKFDLKSMLNDCEIDYSETIQLLENITKEYGRIFVRDIAFIVGCKLLEKVKPEKFDQYYKALNRYYGETIFPDTIMHSDGKAILDGFINQVWQQWSEKNKKLTYSDGAAASGGGAADDNSLVKFSVKVHVEQPSVKDSLTQEEFRRLLASGQRDFQDFNLEDFDLRYMYLKEINLRGAKLGGADLRKADLRNANLCEIDLSRVKLQGAKLQGAKFSADCVLGEVDDDTLFIGETRQEQARFVAMFHRVYQVLPREGRPFTFFRPNFTGQSAKDVFQILQDKKFHSRTAKAYNLLARYFQKLDSKEELAARIAVAADLPQKAIKVEIEKILGDMPARDDMSAAIPVSPGLSG